MKRLLCVAAIVLSLTALLSACGGGGGGGGGTGGGPVLSSDKAITSFLFTSPTATGTINESAKTISVTVPYGTDVTALKATFITTGASVKVNGVEQVSGSSANDFTNSVSYVVTAADNSTATYTVTVTVKAGVIDLPRTGQTTCYDSAASLISCATTTGQGQDGAMQKGIAWPNPRFTDNSDGTVTDNLTGLMWLKDPNCIKTQYPSFDQDNIIGDGQVTWQHALNFVAGVNAGAYPNCRAGHADWRVPNKNELRSLIDYSRNSPALPLYHPFGQTTLYWLSARYWTSTSFDSSFASFISLYDGAEEPWLSKAGDRYVWPVRSSGQAAVAGVPATGQILRYDATNNADDGASQKGIVWPSPRFKDNADGTITDHLTGLMWWKDAGAPDVYVSIVLVCAGGTKNWQNALDYVACANIWYYGGYNDWRLPNANEIESLVRAGYKQVNCSGTTKCATNADWLNSVGFSSAQAYPYWSSTSHADITANAWYVDMTDGVKTGMDKTAYSFYVLPVRGGQ